MPYVRIGRTVYKRVGGHLKKVGRSKSIAKAKKYLNLLRGVEHGMKPRKRRR